MTDAKRAEQVHDLLRHADRLRVQSHRHTVETFLGEIGDLRLGLRRLYRDLTGADLPRESAPRRLVAASFKPGSIPGTRATVAFRARPKALAARA